MKFYGRIGYIGSVEVTPGRFEEQLIAEKDAYGDVNSYRRRLERTENQNQDIHLSNVISILMDPFAQEHFHEIRYVLWQGVRWEATSVELSWPRLNITLGGVYNVPAYTGGAPSGI